MKIKPVRDIDVELIRKIKKGDTDAFRQIVDKYKDVSLSLACSILKDQALAEDVLQDVFLKVYERINDFKFKSAFATWLYRIVVNISYNVLKKSKRELSLEKVQEEGLVDYDVIGNTGLNKADQKRYIILAIAKLKPDEALVLRLFYLCELSIKEIEQSTGFKSSKIKVDLHRGRENLYYHLKKLLGIEIKDLL